MIRAECMDFCFFYTFSKIITFISVFHELLTKSKTGDYLTRIWKMDSGSGGCLEECSSDSDDEYIEISSWAKHGDGDLSMEENVKDQSPNISRSSSLVEAENDFEVESKFQHPLCNELILENIFSLLDVFDLMNCRSVCHKWFLIATPLFINHLDEIQITFSRMEQESDDDGSDNDEETLSGRKEIQKYINYRREGSTISYRNFRFYQVDMTSPTVQELFDSFGSEMHVLKVDVRQYSESRVPDWGDDASDTESESEWASDDEGSYIPVTRKEFLDIPTLRKILLVQCPNLEKLVILSLPFPMKSRRLLEDQPNAQAQFLQMLLTTKINSISIHHEYRTLVYSQRFLTDLFTICPELKEVQVSCNWDSQNQDNKVVHSLIKSNRLDGIKNLSLSDTGYSTINLLADSNSQLETAEFQQFRFGEERIIERFLQRQSNSLESLIFNGLVDSDFILQPMNVNFPTMNKLKTLRMMSHRMTFPNNFGAFDYKLHFPVLKKLELSGEAKHYQLAKLFANMEIQTPHLGLKILELPYGINNPELIKSISKLFPNVDDLTIGSQTDVTFRALFNCWPNLKVLFICVVLELITKAQEKEMLGLDCLLTGIPKVTCKQILKRRNYDIDLSGIKLGPSISNFQKLERLTIHGGPRKFVLCGNRQPGDMITDVSAHFAFMKLTSLKYLSVLQGVHEISESCIATLSQKLDLHINVGRKRVSVELMKYPEREYCRKPMLWSETEVGNTHGGCSIC